MINVHVIVIGITEQLSQVFDKEEVSICFFDDDVQALNAAKKKQPSVILLNFSIRQAETYDYINLLLKASADSKVIVVANKLSDDEILACLVAGAKGYQGLSQLNHYVVKMVKVVDAGEVWITRRMVAKLLDVLVEQ